MSQLKLNIEWDTRRIPMRAIDDSHLQREIVRAIIRAALMGAVLVPPVASAQHPASPQPVLHCYHMRTQIDTAARRVFRDTNGFIVKEIYYTSVEGTLRPSCAEHALREQSTHVYEPDSRGRVLVQTHLRPNGGVEGVWRYEYVADESHPSRRVLFGPQGLPQYEIRYHGGSEESHIYFDEDGGVVGVSGRVPDDLAAMRAWGVERDGWRCGIAVGLRREGDPYRSINVHLLNNSKSWMTARLVNWFETELRDGRGAIVPPTDKHLAESALMPRTSWAGRLLRPGEADFTTLQLDRRYGVLARGRYTLLVRHPHPQTGETLVSNTIIVDIGPAR
jgi:hypothetical protein